MSNTIREFCIPTHLTFGEGSSLKAAPMMKDRGCKRVLLVTDKGVAGTGILDGIIGSFKEVKLDVVVFDEVQPNPSDDIVKKGIKIFESESCDGLLGVGGGSSMDTAKAIGALSKNPGDFNEYEGAEKLRYPPIRIFAIPTTAGTGSEVSAAFVVTMRERKTKISIRSMKAIPEAAFLDPLLLTKLPFKVAGETGMDALSHAVEAYTTTLANPVTDALAESAIRLISENLKPFAANRENTEAGMKMLIASNQAAQAFTWARVALAHSLSMPFGGRYNLGHGLATAIFLPHVMRFNLIAAPEKYARIAQLLGVDTAGFDLREAAQLSVQTVEDLMDDLRIPKKFSDVGVTKIDMEPLLKDIMKANIHAFNPRKVEEKDIVDILQAAL